MKSNRKIITTAFLTLMFIVGQALGQTTGKEIMLKVDQQPDGDTRKSIMKMELINKRDRKRVRSMNSYSKDYGKDKKSIMFFQEPADVKGTGFLTWDYHEEDKNDDRWLYLPAMKKTRRINGSSAKKEYFMGSDFTYDDMGNRNVDEDNHQLLRSEIIKDHECWVIESVPKDQSELYSKRILWVRQDNYMVSRVEYYDKQGEMMKELEVNDMKLTEGYWTSTMMTMSNHQREHRTIIYIESIEYDLPVDDNLFTVNALERGYIN
jgi:outer membrane lipoprotein-sorting protein